MTKTVWKYWVNDRYYFFKTFRVYWAYRWWEAERIESSIRTESKAGVKIENKKGLYSNKYRVRAGLKRI